MSRDCCVALPRGATGCLQFVIVVFPDHTHLQILTALRYDKYSTWLHAAFIPALGGKRGGILLSDSDPPPLLHTLSSIVYIYLSYFLQ